MLYPNLSHINWQRKQFSEFMDLQIQNLHFEFSTDLVSAFISNAIQEHKYTGFRNSGLIVTHYCNLSFNTYFIGKLKESTFAPNFANLETARGVKTLFILEWSHYSKLMQN